MAPDADDGRLKAQQDHYDESWQEALEVGRDTLGNLQANLTFLQRTGLLKATDRILEVGCGTGGLVAALTEQGYDIVGTDISPSATEYGRRKYAGIRLEARPAEELGHEAAFFDKVLSFDLLEHVEHVDRHLREVRRLLKPGGYYLLQTPNKWSNIVFETLRTRSLRWRRYHPSLHTARQLRRRLARHGFTAEFMKVNPVNEFTLRKVRPLARLDIVLRHVDFRRLPLCLQTNLYVIARKQDGLDDRGRGCEGRS